MKTIEKHVELTEAERARLIKATKSGTAKEILYANIILMCSRKQAPKKISEALDISKQTVNNVKQRFFHDGVDKFTVRRNAGKAPYPAKITGEVEAKVVALACSEAPAGNTRWTLKLLSDKTVELGYIDSITQMSIGRLLKKHNLSLT